MDFLSEIESFIRKSLAEEQEAISQYLNRKLACEHLLNQVDMDLKEKLDDFIYTLSDIIEEEKVHVGQLREMLTLFNISFDKELEGEQEAKSSFLDVANKLNTYIKEIN